MWKDVEDREDIRAMLALDTPELMRDYPSGVYIGSHCGERLYLQLPEWSCGWYWSLGHLRGLGSDGTCMQFRSIDTKLFDKEDEFFGDTFLFRRHSHEWWRFMEIMRSLYHLQEQAEFWRHGNMFTSTNNCEHVLADQAMYKRINFVLIPLLVDELYKVLGY